MIVIIIVACERFEPSSHFISKLSVIFWVTVVLNRIVVDSDWHLDNMCSSHRQSQSEFYHVSWLTNQVNNQSLAPSTDGRQRTLTVKITTAQVSNKYFYFTFLQVKYTEWTSDVYTISKKYNMTMLGVYNCTNNHV